MKDLAHIKTQLDIVFNKFLERTLHGDHTHQEWLRSEIMVLKKEIYLYFEQENKNVEV